MGGENKTRRTEQNIPGQSKDQGHILEKKKTEVTDWKRENAIRPYRVDSVALLSARDTGSTADQHLSSLC